MAEDALRPGSGTKGTSRGLIGYEEAAIDWLVRRSNGAAEP
jgi:hypothetical protein